MPRSTLALLTVLFALGVAGPAAAEDTVPVDKAAIEAIVRDYILAHPEVIEQALDAAEAKRVEAEQETQRRALIDLHDALAHDPDTPVAGNADGDVTVVAFTDYRCGFCRRAAPVVEALVAADAGVRVAFKEFPILGPDSVDAARISLAAHRQDPSRYGALHHAIFTSEDAIDEANVLAIAGSLGYDTASLKAAMLDPAIDALLTRNGELAQRLGIRGTPTFIIGATLIPGYSSLTDMQAAVADERACLASADPG